MEKPKTKRQPKNFLRYFVDEYILLRRYFYFELEIAPETIVEQLLILEDKNNHPWESRKIIPTLNKVGNGWQVLIVARQRKKDYQTAKAEGVIYSDENGTSIFKGKVSIGEDFYKAYLIVILFLSFSLFWVALRQSTAVSFAILFPAMFLVPAIGYGVMLYYDGKYLLKSIEGALVEAIYAKRSN